MASVPATLSLMDAILKDRYLLDYVMDRVNKATRFAERVTQKLTISGRKAVFATSFDLNEGVYILSDNVDFGDPLAAKPYNFEVKIRRIYALFDITGPTLIDTRDNLGAFQDALSFQIERTVDGLKVNTAVHMLGDSSGKLAVVKSRTDADTFVVVKPFGLTTYKGDVPVKNIIRRNMPFDITPDGSTFRVTAGQISALTHSATTTTVDWTGTESGTVAANDFLVRASGWNQGFDGFFGAVQTSGTYLNLSRAGNVGWQGVVLDATNGGTTAVLLEPSMLQDAIDLVADSGERPDLILVNYKMRRNIENLYSPQIRFAPQVINAGTSPSPEAEGDITVDKIPVIADRFFPPQHIGFVNTRSWYHIVGQEPEWIQSGNGSVLNFLLSGDKFRAVLRVYKNFCCFYPAANGYLYGVAE